MRAALRSVVSGKQTALPHVGGPVQSVRGPGQNRKTDPGPWERWRGPAVRGCPPEGRLGVSLSTTRLQLKPLFFPGVQPPYLCEPRPHTSSRHVVLSGAGRGTGRHRSRE